MKMSRAILGLVSAMACSTAPVGAWGWGDPYTYRNYSTTTITVRPYNAFADTSCSMSVNGAIPLSLLSQCGGGGCGSGGCGAGGCNTGPCCGAHMVPACGAAPCGYPPCWSGWPSLYHPYADCNCANYRAPYYPYGYYPPAMYYPQAAYYPPPPPVPQPRR